MKAEHKFFAAVLVGFLLTMTGIFAIPLHIPSPWDLLPLIAGPLVTYVGFRRFNKAQAERTENIAQHLSRPARIKRFWLVTIALVVMSGIGIPLAPYMVQNFSPTLYFYIIPFQIVALGFLIFIIWKKLLGPGTPPN